MEKPFVFRPFGGHARSVRIGDRLYLEGDLMLAHDYEVERFAPSYGGRDAFDPLTERQTLALAVAAGYEGGPAGLLPHLKGLSQAHLNAARDRVRGIGDDPQPPGPAAAAAEEAAPILRVLIEHGLLLPDAGLAPATEEAALDLDAMTKAQLIELAESRGIPTTATQRKTAGALREVIRAAREA